MIRKKLPWAPVSRLAVLLCLMAAASPLWPAPGNASEPAIQGKKLLEIIRRLSAPEMEGRAAGSAGEARAAMVIARELRRIGLDPPRALGGYFQRFEMTTGLKLAPGNVLRVAIDNEDKTYAPGIVFTPFGFSDEGSVSAKVVFAGYGISAPELRYDDYAGLDVKGKIVVVMSHEPQEKNPASPFRAPEAFRYTGVRYKVWNAREHGASGIIIVTDPNHHPDQREALFALRGGGGASAGIFAVNALEEAVDGLLARSGKGLSQLQTEIDESLSPRSFEISRALVHLRVALIREKGAARNVVAVLPGVDPKLKREAIVIGAHYDGLGLGGEGSLAPDRHGTIHPGADDNASGVAALLGLAEAFKRHRHRRTLVFAAFSGEELGLLGSAAYVKNPSWPMARTYAMINIDMVGRPVKDRLYALGVDSAPEFRSLLKRIADRSGLDLALSGDGSGPSDHASFYTQGKPVLMFHTGPHADYHRPSDTAEKIDPKGLEKIVRFVFGVVAELADGTGPLRFQKTKGAPPVRREGEGGYGAYFGSIPDFAESTAPGVRLGGVRPGSPAERAGLAAGDIIVRLGDADIRNLHDLLFALRSRRAGEEIEVVYVRGEKKLTARATLEERR